MKNVEQHILSTNKSITDTLKKEKDMKKVIFKDLGLISYNDAYILQTSLFDQVRLENRLGIVLLLEHYPVITIGSNRKFDNLLVSMKRLKKQNIQLVQSTRGGDITFHGPGQIICYPILNLSYIKKDLSLYLSLYVYNLEQVIIEVLETFEIAGIRKKKHRGIFVMDNKIASIGIRIRKWITLHGFSLNVNINLKYFDNIIACGLRDFTQTSMQKISNKTIQTNDVKEQIIYRFSKVFNLPISKI
jgi:lipoyl(octanoyl) transferase